MAKKAAKKETKKEVKEAPKEKQVTKVWNGVSWVTVDEDSPLYKARKQPQG